MKKCALQIVSLCMALFMLSVCGGVNIYHYCCDACRDYGHDIFQTISCEEVHANHHCCNNECSHNHTSHTEIPHNHNDLCAHLNANYDHCDVHHIDAPYLSHLVKYQINFASHLVAIFPISMHNAQCTIHNTEHKVQCEAIPITRNLSGRAIIVRKSAYLI